MRANPTITYNNLYCDYMISYSKDYEKIVENHISTNFLKFGKTKLNSKNLDPKNIKKNSIAYISEFRPNNENIWIENFPFTFQFYF